METPVITLFTYGDKQLKTDVSVFDRTNSLALWAQNSDFEV